MYNAHLVPVVYGIYTMVYSHGITSVYRGLRSLLCVIVTYTLQAVPLIFTLVIVQNVRNLVHLPIVKGVLSLSFGDIAE